MYIQKEVLIAQKKLYTQQRKSMYNQNRLSILAEENKAWISGMAEETITPAVTAVDMKELFNNAKASLWSERDYEPKHYESW
jgi:preprotein translocase subunit SecA